MYRLHECKQEYSKIFFSLPSINQLVDTTIEFNLLTFIDAYSGYHQMLMHSKEEEKTSFIVKEGTFFYTCMPFGLKKGQCINL